MLSTIPAGILEKCQATHPNSFLYLGREKQPVGKSGSFYRLALTCKLHPMEGQLLQRQDSHLRGQNPCPACAKKAREGRDRDSFETVVEKCRAVHGTMYDYSKIGTALGKSTTVTAKCPKGHVFTCTVSNHLYHKSGCPSCTVPRHTLKTAALAAMRVHGMRYTYTGFHQHSGKQRSRISYICPEHGEQTQPLSSHLKGVGCPLCGRAKATQANRVGKEDALAKLARSSSPLRLLEETYAYGTAKASFICPHGHVTQKLPALLEYNPGCFKCSAKISQANRDIQTLLPGAELEGVLGPRFNVDVLLTPARLVVEHHGLIWHSDFYQKSPTYHRDRMLKIQALGYRYLQVFSDEWELRKEACTSIILRAAGLDTSPSVGARKTVACEVPPGEAAAFLDAHHIQGAPRDCTHAFGLACAGELCAVSTFTQGASNRIQLPPGYYELSRFATAGRVPGGFSKLLRYAVLRLGATALRTISDNRLFTGEVYRRWGFQRTAEIPIDYTYIDVTSPGKRRRHKANFQKARLAALLPGADMALPEQALTRQLGLYRVYDAGKVLWTWQA